MIKKKDIKYAALHYINVHEIQDTLLKERKKKERFYQFYTSSS